MSSTLPTPRPSVSENIESGIKRTVIAALRIFFRPSPLAAIELSGIESILVVRQHDQLGDMLCVVPLLRALRNRFPNAFVTLIASPVNEEIMRNHPYVNEVLNYEKDRFLRSPASFLRFWRQLKARRYDLAIVPTTVSISVTSNLIAFLSGARIRVGPEILNDVPSPTSFLFNVAARLQWEGDPHRHQVLRNLDILKPLDIPADESEILVGITDEEKSEAARFLSPFRLEHGALIGLHPGAGKPLNRWPAERFAETADRLCEKFSAVAVITAGAMDDEPLNSMLRHIRCRYTLVRGRPLRAVAAIISQLNLFITNDTGIMHVAAATGVPTLSLFGPTDPLQWAPMGSKHRYIVAGDGHISSITVEEVVQIAGAMMRL